MGWDYANVISGGEEDDANSGSMDYVYHNIIRQDLMCVICQQLTSLDSYVTKKCSHVMCLECAHTLVEDASNLKRCPGCCGEVGKLKSFKDSQSLTYRILQKVRVRCAHTDSCAWIGEYGKVHEHICSCSESSACGGDGCSVGGTERSNASTAAAIASVGASTIATFQSRDTMCIPIEEETSLSASPIQQEHKQMPMKMRRRNQSIGHASTYTASTTGTSGEDSLSSFNPVSTSSITTYNNENAHSSNNSNNSSTNSNSNNTHNVSRPTMKKYKSRKMKSSSNLDGNGKQQRAPKRSTSNRNISPLRKGHSTANLVIPEHTEVLNDNNNKTEGKGIRPSRVKRRSTMDFTYSYDTTSTNTSKNNSGRGDESIKSTGKLNGKNEKKKNRSSQMKRRSTMDHCISYDDDITDTTMMLSSSNESNDYGNDAKSLPDPSTSKGSSGNKGGTNSRRARSPRRQSNARSVSPSMDGSRISRKKSPPARSQSSRRDSPTRKESPNRSKSAPDELQGMATKTKSRRRLSPKRPTMSHTRMKSMPTSRDSSPASSPLGKATRAKSLDHGIFTGDKMDAPPITPIGNTMARRGAITEKDFYTQCAEAHLASMEHQKCISACNEALKLDNLNENAYNYKSLAQMELDKFEDAVSTLTTASKKLPKSEKIQTYLETATNLSQIVTRLGSLQESKDYDEIIQITDTHHQSETILDNKFCMLVRARAYFHLNETDNAIREVDNILEEKDPKCVEAYLIRSKSNYLNANLEMSLIDCEKAILLQVGDKSSRKKDKDATKENNKVAEDTLKRLQMVADQFQKINRAFEQKVYTDICQYYSDLIQITSSVSKGQNKDKSSSSSSNNNGEILPPLHQKTELYRKLYRGSARAQLLQTNDEGGGKGNSTKDNDNYIQKALTYIHYVLESNPKDIDAWMMKITCMEKLNRHRELVNQLESIVNKNSWGSNYRVLVEAHSRALKLIKSSNKKSNKNKTPSTTPTAASHRKKYSKNSKNDNNNNNSDGPMVTPDMMASPELLGDLLTAPPPRPMEIR